jgi:parallel beta-helix repeat protein
MVQSAGIQGLELKGLGASTACVGIRFQDAEWCYVRGCTFGDFADEAIIYEDGFASHIADNFVNTALLDRTRASVTGALSITGGGDLIIRNNEIGLSCHADNPAYTMNASMWCNAVYDAGGGVNFYEGNVFENSDCGIYVDGATHLRLVNNRADLNYGHGFYFINTTHCQISNCLALNNSKATDNIYNGFHFGTGTSYNQVSNCRASSNAAVAVDHRYGFKSTTSHATPINNTFVDCFSDGHGTEPGFDTNDDGAYGAAVTWPIGPPRNLGDDATPSVAQWHNFRIDQTGGAQTITDFDNGINGQIIYLLAQDSETTLQHGTNIYTRIGEDLNLTSSRIYSFIQHNAIWYQIGDAKFKNITTAADTGDDGTISSRSGNALGECDGFHEIYTDEGTLTYVPYWEAIAP